MLKPAPAVNGVSPGNGRRAPARTATLYPSSQLYPSSTPPLGLTKSARIIDTAAVATTSNSPHGLDVATPIVDRSGMCAGVVSTRLGFGRPGGIVQFVTDSARNEQGMVVD